MTTTTPAKAAKTVPVRIPPELLVRVDAARGMVPRERYVRWMLGQALDVIEQDQREHPGQTGRHGD